jgi:hypothetical protein
VLATALELAAFHAVAFAFYEWMGVVVFCLLLLVLGAVFTKLFGLLD